MLSQDPVKFLEQLLLETREESEHKTSQYNGNYSPTATPQEVMAVMDMGGVAHKNHDGSISFSLPRTCEEPKYFNSHNTHIEKSIPPSLKFLGRNHTFDGTNVSNPPPYQDWLEHFRSPSSSQKSSPC